MNQCKDVPTILPAYFAVNEWACNNLGMGWCFVIAFTLFDVRTDTLSRYIHVVWLCICTFEQ